ncbi:pyruvate dehydrogenase complex dihydrolipoamide acetyltransferase component (E2), partial [Friedmanniomyces endolithicus]
MVEEGEDVSAFESFTLDDAGGEKEPPKEQPKEEASEATETPDSGSPTAPPGGAKESKESAPEP